MGARTPPSAAGILKHGSVLGRPPGPLRKRASLSMLQERPDHATRAQRIGTAHVILNRALGVYIHAMVDGRMNVRRIEGLRGRVGSDLVRRAVDLACLD